MHLFFDRRLAAATVALATGLGALFPPHPALAAPFTPSDDTQVLERMPSPAGAGELRSLQAAWRAAPRDLDTATRLAWRYQAELAASGDPRYAGWIQAALAPWWQQPEPPNAVRVLRAVVLQFDHRFEPALADLAAVLRADPGDVAALSWQLAIQLVRADLPAARASCGRLAPLVSSLVGTACAAQVDALSGRAGPAAAALQRALEEPGADPAEALWSLTRLAEIGHWRGDTALAERTFQRALALQRPDVYLEAAWADFLLDQRRPAEVLQRLKDARADVLLLRLALAAKAAGNAEATAVHTRALQARFDAARLRGDTSHRKEEARFRLEVLGDSAAALPLARENFAEQKEPADALLLLRVALAARDKAAAQPALQWLQASGFEGVAWRALATQIGALP
jgi:Tfp pilus assembly protein PilF